MTIYPLSTSPPLVAEYIAVPLTFAGRSSWFLLMMGIHLSGCPNTTLSDVRVGSSTYVTALQAVGVCWGVSEVWRLSFRGGSGMRSHLGG